MNVNRDKFGRFITRKRKLWLDNVTASNKKRYEEKKKILNVESQQPTYIDVDGRRVIEVKTLAENLWCNVCDIPLSLRNIVSDVSHGLSSVWEIICDSCSTKHRVRSCKSHEKLTSHFNINGKLIAAMYDIGIGPYKLNDFLSILNIPIIHPKILKKYEQFMSEIITTCAEESFRESIRLEKELTMKINAAEEQKTTDEGDERKEVDQDGNNVTLNIQNDTSNIINDNNEAKSEEVTEIKISFDSAWQSRGSGRSRNSITGHSSIMGHYSGLVLGVATRNKRCIACERNISTEKHSCTSDWKGSSKAMEPDMAVELIVNNKMLMEEKTRVGVLIGDDDSSVMSNIKKAASWEIKKWSDLNHVTKNLTSQLYTMKLSRKVINYFSNRFVSIVKSNKNKPDLLRSRLLSLVDHAHGNHNQCGDWCGFLQNPETYQYKDLPHKGPLSTNEATKKLHTIFENLADDSEKLAPCGSTQRNESFNHTVTVSHPKTLHYAAGVSFKPRILTAALKSNYKSSYVLKINEKAGYSPGKNTQKFRQKKDSVYKVRLNMTKSLEFKKKRKLNKLKKSSANNICENREGISYSSNCASLNISSLLNVCIDDDNFPNRDEVLIFFDLETSSRKVADTEICQVAAISGDHTFNQFCVPSFITSEASKVTKMSVNNNQLYYGGEKIKTIPVDQLLQEFISFLEEVSDKKGVILVAHNCFRFDAVIIMRYIQTYGLFDRFKNVVKGFSDTLIVFRVFLPERKKLGKSFSQSSMLEDFLPGEYGANAHNAIVDVKNLQKLVDKKFQVHSLIFDHSKSIKNLVCNKLKPSEKNNAFMDFHLSTRMINKLISANVTRDILKEVYLKKGCDGVKLLLGENINGKPRVTTNSSIVNKILHDLKTICENESNIAKLNSDFDIASMENSTNDLDFIIDNHPSQLEAEVNSIDNKYNHSDDSFDGGNFGFGCTTQDLGSRAMVENNTEPHVDNYINWDDDDDDDFFENFCEDISINVYDNENDSSLDDLPMNYHCDYDRDINRNNSNFRSMNI